MQKKHFFLLNFFMIFLSMNVLSNSCDCYYKTSFLKQYGHVRKQLKNEGFKELYFKTPDGLRLNGMFLERPHARCNVIVCAGWLPGRMEAMATFFSLLPRDCNIFLFDARGHGKSEGPLFREVWRYGVNEYKDIIGGIYYLNYVNQLPIIICGICSGAFNAAHALVHVSRCNLMEKFLIKGLVFDSGWGSVTKISSSIVVSGVERRILTFLSKWHKTKDKNILKQSIIYKGFLGLVKSCYSLFHSYVFKRFVEHHESVTNLFDKISSVACPIFFIHSLDDSYAEFSDVMNLISLSHQKESWILEQSDHAKHHIKQKDLYKEKIALFINAVLD